MRICKLLESLSLSLSLSASIFSLSLTCLFSAVVEAGADAMILLCLGKGSKKRKSKVLSQHLLSALPSFLPLVHSSSFSSSCSHYFFLSAVTCYILFSFMCLSHSFTTKHFFPSLYLTLKYLSHISFSHSLSLHVMSLPNVINFYFD